MEKKRKRLRDWFLRDFWGDLAPKLAGLLIVVVITALNATGLPITAWLQRGYGLGILAVLIIAMTPLVFLILLVPKFLTRRRLETLRERLKRLDERIRGFRAKSDEARLHPFDPVRRHPSPELIPPHLKKLMGKRVKLEAEIAALEANARELDDSLERP